ncbi:MAG: plasmid replication, integration and excision activator, partial [Angustibacter sp.]
MAMQRRIKVEHGDVFPAGAFLKGLVEPVLDFTAAKREDGSRPQATDKDTGVLLWQVTVLDADEEAGRKDTAVSVKIAA